jgi:hypothetical protein
MPRAPRGIVPIPGRRARHRRAACEVSRGRCARSPWSSIRPAACHRDPGHPGGAGVCSPRSRGHLRGRPQGGSPAPRCRTLRAKGPWALHRSSPPGRSPASPSLVDAAVDPGVGSDPDVGADRLRVGRRWLVRPIGRCLRADAGRRRCLRRMRSWLRPPSKRRPRRRRHGRVPGPCRRAASGGAAHHRRPSPDHRHRRDGRSPPAQSHHSRRAPGVTPARSGSHRPCRTPCAHAGRHRGQRKGGPGQALGGCARAAAGAACRASCGMTHPIVSLVPARMPCVAPNTVPRAIAPSCGWWILATRAPRVDDEHICHAG